MLWKKGTIWVPWRGTFCGARKNDDSQKRGIEFVKRFGEGKGELPLLTSCCPAWTDWMEKYAPDFTENFSTAKPPQQMLFAWRSVVGWGLQRAKSWKVGSAR